jgi:hypothetical protein
MPVGAVDCDVKENQGLCSKYGVKSFPTIKLFSSDKIRNPYTRVLDKDVTDYKGGRDTKGLMEAAGKLLTDLRITKVGSMDDFEAFYMSKPDVPKVCVWARETGEGGGGV